MKFGEERVGRQLPRKVLRGNLKASTLVLAGAYLFSVFSLKITHDVNAHWPSFEFNICFLFQFKFIIAGVLLALHENRFQSLCRGLNPIIPVIAFALLFAEGNELIHAHVFALFFSSIDALIIAFLVLWTMDNPQWVGFLRWAPVQCVGACSYSLYLWQQMFVGSSTQYGAIPLNRFPFSIVLIFATAALSYYFIERRFIGIGRKLLNLYSPTT